MKLLKNFQFDVNYNCKPNIPNALSLLRVILSADLYYHYYVNKDIDLMFMVLFSIAVLSDKLDGYFAKKLNAVTTLGKLLDPVADKILIFVVMLVFWDIGILPLWAIAITVIKDLALSAYRYAKYKKGIIIPALKLGRYKTAYNLLIFGILFFILYLNVSYIDGQVLFWMRLVLLTTIL